jgi:hypothetical protein
MKKLFRTVAIAAIALTMNVAANAQTTSFNKGDNIAGVAVGLGGYYSGSYYSDVSRLPFVSFYYENCVKDNLFDDKSSLSIGGMLGYTQVKLDKWWKTSTTVVGVRGALHYALVDKLDTYAGLMLGYNIVSWKWFDSEWGLGSSGNASSGLALGGYIGARYYLTDTLAAFAEEGYGAANLNLGVAFKF